MGKSVESTVFGRDDYRRYRHKVRRCLDVFAQMLDDFRFDEDKPMTGLEIEINLVDDSGLPAMRNTEILDGFDNPDFQAELGLFNLEFNVPPRLISGDGFLAYERYLRDGLAAAETKANQVDAGL